MLVEQLTRRKPVGKYRIKFVHPRWISPPNLVYIDELTQGETGIEFRPNTSEVPTLLHPLFRIDGGNIIITSHLPGREDIGASVTLKFPWRLIDRFYTLSVAPKDQESLDKLSSLMNDNGYKLVPM